ncbi:MAG: hypothetical protein AB7O96_08550 [Pseudobdellovibrionaceae bacterium]
MITLKIFKPLHMQFWLNPASALANELEQKISPNLRYVVGTIGYIQTIPNPNNYEKVSFRSINDNSYRAWYEELYKDFHSNNEELKDWVPVNDEDDMNACLKDRLLFLTCIENEKAGLIAAKRKDLLGKSGVYMTEVLLSKDFKGKGYAPAIQRKFIDELPKDIELVWGTIDTRNVSSTKSAFRVGRRSIRSEFFVPID